jgi:ABC-type transporter Mla MlaB component
VKAKKAKHGRVVLEGAVTLRTIDSTHAALREALAKHAKIEIDCATATEIDLSAIQLLLAARKSAEAAGKSLALSAPADGALRDALSRGGFLPNSPDSTATTDSFWLKGSGA